MRKVTQAKHTMTLISIIITGVRHMQIWDMISRQSIMVWISQAM